MNPNEQLSQETLNELNPLLVHGTAGVSDQLLTPGAIISRVLTFAFPLAGLMLFVLLVYAGAEIFFGATEKKSLDQGKNRATAAIIGFMLLFASYWFVQIIEVIFGVRILGTPTP